MSCGGGWEEGGESGGMGVQAELAEGRGEDGWGQGAGVGAVEDFEGFAHAAEQGLRDVAVAAVAALRCRKVSEGGGGTGLGGWCGYGCGRRWIEDWSFDGGDGG